MNYLQGQSHLLLFGIIDNEADARFPASLEVSQLCNGPSADPDPLYIDWDSGQSQMEVVCT